MERIFQDFRYGFRSLLKRPGATLVALDSGARVYEHHARCTEYE